jgi:hypothetical protein
VRATIFALATTLVLAAPCLSEAQTEDVAAGRERARPIAEKAYDAFETERYADAIRLFREAEGYFHAPPHVLFTARAQVALGQLVAARDSYQSIVAEQLASYAPDAFLQAQHDAERELAALRPRIPVVTVVIRGVPREQVRLTIDGGPSDAPRSSYDLDPGPHLIRAAGEGGETVEVRIDLVEGARRDVAVVLHPASTPAAPAADADGVHTLLVPAIACFAVGATTLAAGIVTGVLSLEKVGDIESRCVDGHCPPEDEDEASTARSLGDASTALLVIGGAGLVAGTALLVVGWPVDSAATSAVRLQVHAGGMSVTATFH